MPTSVTETQGSWSLLSNHGMVLCEIAAAQDVTVRELSDLLGVTERHISRIVYDLGAAGMLEVRRVGTRNRYSIAEDAHFRHPRFAHIRIGALISALARDLAPRTRPEALTPTWKDRPA